MAYRLFRTRLFRTKLIPTFAHSDTSAPDFSALNTYAPDFSALIFRTRSFRTRHFRTPEKTDISALLNTSIFPHLQKTRQFRTHSILIILPIKYKIFTSFTLTITQQGVQLPSSRLNCLKNICLGICLKLNMASLQLYCFVPKSFIQNTLSIALQSKLKPNIIFTLIF